MKWKPEETDIIDYLYGSMTADNKAKFEVYMESNPELQQEVRELLKAKEILPEFKDQEVIPFLPLSGTRGRKLTSVRAWLYPVSIAASIVAILLVGYLTNFRMSFNSTGFELGFEDPVNNENALDKGQLEKIVAQKVNEYTKEFNGQLEFLSTNFEDQLAANQVLTERQLKQIANRPASVQLDDAQVLGFIAQLQDENKKMMQNFYQISAEEQQVYLRNILLEYSEYLENQRREDLQFIQANLLDIKSNSALRQEETDKILANIISTVNNQNSPYNDRLSLD